MTSATSSHTAATGELPVLPLRNLVLFPGVVTTVTIGRESSMALIKHISSLPDDEAYFAVMTQVDAEVEYPQFETSIPSVRWRNSSV